MTAWFLHKERSNKMNLNEVSFRPASMVTHDNLQRVDLLYTLDSNAHLLLDVWNGDKLHAADYPLDLLSGERYFVCMLPVPEADFTAHWAIKSCEGIVLAKGDTLWKLPRHWEISVMISSHTDIGLHNSQYIQRYNSQRFLDEAMRLCDATDDRPENDRYRYTMEGTWFWSNYEKDRTKSAADRLVRDYIQTGKIGICAGIAGNTTQVYGLEELCRSTYPRQWLKHHFDIESRTMTMIDNNGLTWGLVQPYVDAGYENLFFAPNCWNPLPSTITKNDTFIPGAYAVPTYIWNPQAGGGGSRIDVRYDSPLPMVFYWQAPYADRKLLVFCSAQYDRGGNLFGLMPEGAVHPELWEDLVSKQLSRLEARYPYEMWLLANYGDDQYPNLTLTDHLAAWNAKWKYPVFRTLGNPDTFFDSFREKYADSIPTLRGEITGGWYQLAVSVADALADKFEADRTLPRAETLASFASLADPEYGYPEESFRRAWEYLLTNDEHSYGCSGYAGSPVFETWMQHRQWVEDARRIADVESERAKKAIAAKASITEDSVLVFNTTLQTRSEWIHSGGKSAFVQNIVPAGYTSVPKSAFSQGVSSIRHPDSAPVIENAYYRICFSSFGGMNSIYDKMLRKELLSPEHAPANTLLYTNDNHKTFFRPEDAVFTVTETPEGITVIAVTCEPVSGAAISQTVSLPADEKVIRIENNLQHVNGLFNRNRYNRFLYYAFPFHVQNARRLCHLNGCVAQYAKDLTGHGTDTYMNVRDWCCMENDTYGVGFMQLDSCLVEFDHIHPDKTDWDRAGDGSELYLYLANDWHQRQVKGGSELNFRFRYQITSYAGNHLSAGLPEMAERFANPLTVTEVSAHPGTLPDTFSFLHASSPVRLLTVKRRNGGSGLTARIYAPERPIHSDFKLTLSAAPQGEQCFLTPDENSPLRVQNTLSGFATLSLGADILHVKTACREAEPASHASVGSWETGLIRHPRAGCSDEIDLIYLLWGQNMDKDLAYYEVFRGDTADFPTEDTEPYAVVEPGPYRVVRCEDHGCAENTRYYYRVRAVFTDGTNTGLSEVFSGATREPGWVETEPGHRIIP